MVEPSSQPPESPQPEGSPLRRGDFLRLALIAVGAGAGVLAGLPVRAAPAQGDAPAGDAEILSSLLALEKVSFALYEQGFERLPLADGLRELVELFGNQEAEHDRVLRLSLDDLGIEPESTPAFDVEPGLSSDERFLSVVQEVEDLSVAAYNGAIEEIDSKQTLAVVASIAQVEARHASAVRLRRGQSSAPEPFAQAIDEAELNSTLPTIFGQ